MVNQGKKANKSGARHEVIIHGMFYGCFDNTNGKNIMEVEGNSMSVLKEANGNNLLNEHHYLGRQTPYVKMDGSNGRVDFVYYSSDIPEGIVVECMSQSVAGSKLSRLNFDVDNLLFVFEQKYKILVLGGDMSAKLKKIATKILLAKLNIFSRKKRKKLIENVFIVTNDELPQLLKDIKEENDVH